MHHAFRFAAAAIAAGMLSSAHAGSDQFQRIEFFGSWAQIDADDTTTEEFDGIGGGLRVVGGQRVGFFGDFSGEYVPTERDDGGADLDFENYRAGAGWGFPAGPVGFFQLKAEYASLRTERQAPGGKVKESQDGYGVHLQFEQDLPYSLGVHASLGYLDLDDADGIEYVIGVHWVPDVFGFFAQYRWDDLDIADSDAELRIDTVRAGFRVPF
ncbi:outer membrane beta-barrel protein [Sinimarinibacterium thermocellulolyticum]|uniref:Outer membrane protein beta-barrel domain-containing protein n=1 Tax=Sinimarinibacterium thermocellulolyticum TaxID=3170016 RepID=A0ABV2ACN3_9GAMM